jgi:hypothetical protein
MVNDTGIRILPDSTYSLGCPFQLFGVCSIMVNSRVQRGYNIQNQTIAS